MRPLSFMCGAFFYSFLCSIPQSFRSARLREMTQEMFTDVLHRFACPSFALSKNDGDDRSLSRLVETIKTFIYAKGRTFVASAGPPRVSIQWGFRHIRGPPSCEPRTFHCGREGAPRGLPFMDKEVFISRRGLTSLVATI